MPLSSFCFVFEVVPEVQEGEEVARRVDEAGVQLVGLGALLERTFARILDAEAATIAMTSRVVPCFFDSMTMRASRGSIGSRVSCLPTLVIRGSVVELVETAPQLAQQVEAVLDAARVGRLQEREVLRCRRARARSSAG